MPDWTSAIASRLARLALRPAREREIIEELSQHLDDRYQELRARGASHDEAMTLAIDEIDDEDLLAREMRPLRQASMPEPIAAGGPTRTLFGDAWQDLVYAARMLRKSPGFAAAAILTLALGIGANTAIFSLVNATLLQRLPVQNRDRLLYVFNGPQWNTLSYPAYAALRDGNRMLDGLAAWGGITASLNADGETDLVSGVIVTGNFFEVLGLAAGRGRLLSTTDDVTPGAHPVAVISHRLWQRRFAGRPDIVGSQIRLNGGVFTIVGVTPPAFPGPQLGVMRDVYVPMMMQALMRPPRAGYSGEQNPDLLKNPNNGWLFQVGLRKPGITAAQVQSELVAVATTYSRTANPIGRPQLINVVPLDAGDPNQRRQMRSVAVLLACVVGAVLLIACANVANLLLSKAASRRREIAIRLALGASRWRIVRQLLTESVLLATIGGGAGLLLAWTVVQSFQAAPPPAGALPIALEFAVDRRVLIFSLGLSILTGVVFGAAPALQASRPGLVPALKDESFVADGRARRFNLKRALVVAEVALSLMLLIAAGLFIRSLRVAQTIDPGFAVGELVSAPLSVNLLRYTKAQGRDFYQRATARMEQIPGVTAASVARIALLTGGARVTTIAVEGRPDSGNRSQSEGGGVRAAAGQTAMANVIGPGFFKTLGIPLLRGRDFNSQDTETGPLVVIVSETFAKQFFPGEDALGKRFTTGFSNASGQWAEIVGIARDSKYTSLSESDSPVTYMPLVQRHETGVTLYVRANVPPGTLVAQVRREIQAIEPNLPVPDIQTMNDTIGAALYAPRMGAMLLTVFGALALLLASLGVYGVLAFSISRRTREIGIRMALGADRRSVFALVIREGMWLVGIGLAIGLGAGLYASASLESFLYDISTRDVTTFTSVPCVLAAVALLACYLPARRAMQVDPMVALRDS
jgi:macrolide transport system ATP-binding/permease protein